MHIKMPGKTQISDADKKAHTIIEDDIVKVQTAAKCCSIVNQQAPRLIVVSINCAIDAGWDTQPCYIKGTTNNDGDYTVLFVDDEIDGDYIYLVEDTIQNGGEEGIICNEYDITM